MNRRQKLIAQGMQNMAAKAAKDTGAWEVQSAYVKSVDEAKGTMVAVSYVTEQEVEDVLLRGTDAEGTEGFVQIPDADSDVIIGTVDGSGEWVLLVASKLKKVVTTIGTTKLTMDDKGYEIKRGSETLAKLLDDTFNAIAQLTVTTGTGPSGVPINLTAFQQIQQRAKNLLK